MTHIPLRNYMPNDWTYCKNSSGNKYQLFNFLQKAKYDVRCLFENAAQMKVRDLWNTGRMPQLKITD